MHFCGQHRIRPSDRSGPRVPYSSIVNNSGLDPERLLGFYKIGFFLFADVTSIFGTVSFANDFGVYFVNLVKVFEKNCVT